MFLHALWNRYVTWSRRDRSAQKDFPVVELHDCYLQSNETLKYVWLNLRSEHDGGCESNKPELQTDEWLNIIDESAALGANSMVVSSGERLSDFPGLWKVCDWAQSIHGMHVGIHVQKSTLTEDELSQLSMLEKRLTCLVVDKSQLEMLESLNVYGIPIIASNVDKARTSKPCTESGTLACVEADGTLQKCGLVGCKQKYPLGNALAQPILELVKKEQAISHHSHSNPLITSECEACPSLVAEQMAIKNRE